MVAGPLHHVAFWVLPAVAMRVRLASEASEGLLAPVTALDDLRRANATQASSSAAAAGTGGMHGVAAVGSSGRWVFDHEGDQRPSGRAGAPASLPGHLIEAANASARSIWLFDEARWRASLRAGMLGLHLPQVGSALTHAYFVVRPVVLSSQPGEPVAGALRLDDGAYDDSGLGEVDSIQHVREPSSDGVLIAAGVLLGVGVLAVLAELRVTWRETVRVRDAHASAGEAAAASDSERFKSAQLEALADPLPEPPHPRRWLFLGVSLIALFGTDLWVGMPATFVSGEAQQRYALNLEFMGAYTSAPPISGLIAPVLGAHMMSYVGIPDLHRLAVGLVLVTALPQAFANQLRPSDARGFTAITLALRLMEGVPTYLSEQCVAALQYRLFPASELPAVVSVVVISRGVVGLAGAPLGGALYENGGWSLPYVFVGGWNLATLALMALVVGVGRGGRSVMPPPRVEPLMRVLRVPGVLASCVSYFSAFACLAVLEVIWQPWLGTAPYSYSPTKIVRRASPRLASWFFAACRCARTCASYSAARSL